MKKAGVDGSAARDFFQLLFPDAVDEDHRLILWSLPTRATHSFASIPAAIEHLAALPAGTDAYFACCLMRGERRAKDEAAVVPGVWVDIDCAVPGKKKVYPPEPDVALEAVRGKIPLDPTAVVHSGGGVHAWWLFDEPWVLESPAEHERATQLLRGFQATIRETFAARGWELDATHDLARVLRPVGTRNSKYGEGGKPVRLLVEGGPRYDPATLEEWTWELPLLEGVPGEAVVDLMAEWGVRVPEGDSGLSEALQRKLDLVMGLDAQLKATWEGRRGEFGHDQSRYDLSLAAILMAQEGAWTDQEVVDLLVELRRRLKGTEAKRPDYYARTLLRARREAEADGTVGAARSAAETLSGSGSTKGSSKTKCRQEAVQALSELLLLQVVRVERIVGRKIVYRVHVDVPDVGLVWVDLRNIERLDWVIHEFLYQARHQLDRDDAHAKRLKAAWRSVVTLLVKLAEDVMVHGTSEATGILDVLIERLLAGSTSAGWVKSEEEVGTHGVGSFLRGRELYVDMSNLAAAADIEAPRQYTPQDLAAMLRTRGVRQEKPRVTTEHGSSRRLRRWVWILPEPEFDDEEPDEGSGNTGNTGNTPGNTRSGGANEPKNGPDDPERGDL